MPIREIRINESGKFELVDEQVDVLDLGQLRRLRDDVRAAQDKAQKALDTIKNNLEQIEAAIARSKTAKGG
jgi:hypothetical protein